MANYNKEVLAPRKILVMVKLDSIDKALCNDNGYWFATYDSLTWLGKLLFDVIKNTYGKKPEIVTILDK